MKSGDQIGGTAVFGVKGFPHHQVRGKGAVYVPLLPRLSALSVVESDRTFNPSFGLTRDVHERLQDELEVRWDAFCSDHADIGAEHHQYEFVAVVAHLILWRWMIRQAFEVLQPSEIVLPLHCREQAFHIASQTDLIAWLPYGLLAEECADLHVIYGEEDIPQRVLPRQSVKFRIVEISCRVVRRARVVATQWRLRANPSIYSGEAPKQVRSMRPKRRRNLLVIAQFGKVEGILRRRIGRFRLRFISYDAFHLQALGKDSSPPTTTVLRSDRVDDSIMRYLTLLVVAGQAAEPRLEHMAAANWAALITDAQHDPLMRRLVDHATRMGKEVATVPEGASLYVDELARYGAPYFITDPHVKKFVIDERHRAQLVTQGIAPSRVEVSGYLGNTATASATEALVFKQLLRLCMPTLSEITTGCTVLLSYDDFFVNFEVPTFGAASFNESSAQLVQITEELLNSGHRVLAKTRDHEVAAFIGERFKGEPLLVSAYMPWTALVDFSSLVITRDSSIGWESISLGKPVLVWNFSDYPSWTEVTLRGFSPNWVRVARCVEDLEPNIQSLLASNLARQKEFELTGKLAQPLVARRPGLVIDWINSL